MRKELSLKRGKRYTYLIFIVFLFMFLVFIFSLNYRIFNGVLSGSRAFFRSMFSSTKFPYKVQGSLLLPGNAVLINGDLAVLTSNSFEVVSLSGTKFSKRSHNFSNPAIKSCKNKAIAYDIGGTSYSVEFGLKSGFSASSDFKIICADISSSGIYAIVSESAAYLSQLTVFNRDKTEKYKYNFADFYVCSVSLKQDGSGAAVCGVSSLDGQVKSIIYVFDFNSKEPAVTYDVDDNMLFSVNYLSNKNLVAVGDEKIVFIDTRKNFKNGISYDLKSLKCVHIDPDFGVAYSLCVPGSNNCSLSFLDKNGDLKFENKIDCVFKSILCTAGKIIGSGSGKLFVYSATGKLQNEIKRADRNSVLLGGLNSSVFVLENGNIDKVNLF